MAAQYIPHQVPLFLTRVTNLLNSIEPCVDPNIAAYRAGISIESTGMWKDLDKGAETLLPVDLVANKLCRKRKNAQVSGVTGSKKTRPKTGVKLRFYKYKEFAALTDAQREELHELHPKGKGSDRKYKFGKDKGQFSTPTNGNNHTTKKQMKG